jgi:Zn-dependent protease with chaperone function
VLERSQGEPLPPPMQAFGINTGQGVFMGLFMTHPPLDARIAALLAPDPETPSNGVTFKLGTDQ